LYGWAAKHLDAADGGDRLSRPGVVGSRAPPTWRWCCGDHSRPAIPLRPPQMTRRLLNLLTALSLLLCVEGEPV
jgi:hypothetical protein